MSNLSYTHVVFDHDSTLVDVNNGKILYVGIKELVVFLKKRGVKCYVWTARNRFSTVEILKSLSIIDFFEDLYCSTDGDPKPSPVGLQQMLEGIDSKKVLVIGDSVTDMYGSKSYGAIAIGAIWDNPSAVSKKILMESGADYICESVDECKKLLEKLL